MLKDNEPGGADDRASRLHRENRFYSSMYLRRCRDRRCARGKLVPKPVDQTPWLLPVALLGEPRSLFSESILFVTTWDLVAWEWNRDQFGPNHEHDQQCHREPNTHDAKIQQFRDWFRGAWPGDAERRIEQSEVTQVALSMQIAAQLQVHLGLRPWANGSLDLTVCMEYLAQQLVVMVVRKCPALQWTEYVPISPVRPLARRHCALLTTDALELWKPRSVVCFGGTVWFWLRALLDSQAELRGFRAEWSQSERQLPYGALYWNDGSVTRLAVSPLSTLEGPDSKSALAVLRNLGHKVVE